MTHNILFKASLSNGETLIEDKGILRGDANGSPWVKLQQYVADNGLTITSLSLFTKDGRTFNLPSMAENPRFKAAQGAQPVSYMVKRNMAANISRGGETMASELFTVGVANYDGYRLEIWVDENNPRNSWSLIL